MSGWSRRRPAEEDGAERELRRELEALRQERAEQIALSRAARAAQQRAMREELTGVELRVFTAVLWFTEGWQRWDDEVYLSQLGAQAGIGGTAESRATEAGRAVRHLADLGIVDYHGGRGRSAPSRIGIPRVVLHTAKGEDTTLLKPPDELHDEAPPEAEKESPEAEKESRNGEKESHCDSPTRRDPEDLSETPDACAPATPVDNPPADLGRPGVFDRGSKPQGTPRRAPPGQVLLEGVAARVPPPARHQLLDDTEQAAGRKTLRRRLVRLEALVGFEAAVVVVAGEWPAACHSPMALAISRADKRLHPPAQSPDPPGQGALDGFPETPPASQAAVPQAPGPTAHEPRAPPPINEWRRALTRRPPTSTEEEP